MPLLPPEALCRACDATDLGFATTDDLEDLSEVLGQDRAVDAIRFAAEMPQDGYNLYVLGRTGTGRHHLVQRLLAAEVADGPVPDDWCYVRDFDQPGRPRCLRLPPGKGAALRSDVERLVEDLRVSIPAAFESEDFRARHQALLRSFEERKEAALEDFREEAGKRGIALLSGPAGLGIAPLKDGQPISSDAMEALPEEEQARLMRDMEEVSEILDEAVQKIPRLVSEQEEAQRELAEQTTTRAVEHLVAALRERWSELPDVLAFLEAVTKDVIDDPSCFVGEEDPEEELLSTGPRERRYQVNVLVDRSEDSGAPLIYEDNPTLSALVGRVEHLSRMGNLVTDHSLIRPGALHRANGGFLVVDADKLLTKPLAWEQLKRALRSGEIRIESLGDAMSLVSTVTLEPEPVPLSVKVVLVGDRQLYYLLDALDPEFGLLFKVPADFEDELDRTPEATELYARMVATLVRYNGLRPFHRSAVAQVLTEASRMAGDGTKLTTHVDSLADLLRAADHHARRAGRDVVVGDDVRGAVTAERERSGRVRDGSLEMMVRGTVRIATEGTAVGEVNGLAVVALGRASFGRPGRITARVRMGRGQVVDIEREVELGGPIHSKGVMILAGFVGANYAPEHPLALSAMLAFEQSYGPVDGDSASLAETVALLSSVAELPVRQDIAITGSIDLNGRVQAVGGVNEKVEGFFDLCAARGLTGTQGVLLPATNATDLMLREDVVEAASKSLFSVWTAEHVDEALALLTGLEAGVRDETGEFPEGSVNRLIEERLVEMAVRAVRYDAEHSGG